MKNTKHCIWLLILFGLIACGTGCSSDENTAEPAVRELQEGEILTSFIAVEGEVDTYHIRAAETNRFMRIHCEERTSGSGVDLLVTVFEEINGQRVRIFGKHKPDGVTLGADLDLYIYVDRPKDLYITVRDLLDNEASSSSDAIDQIGEVDCFTFAPGSNGVYGVNVDHHKPAGGTAVQLAVTLYDRNGNRIQRLADPHHTIMAYLERDSGPYFVIVEDSDSMNGDAGAPYDTSRYGRGQSGAG